MYRQASFFHQSNDDPAEKCWRKVNTLLWHHSYSQKYIQLSVTYDWRASIASCRWTCMTTSFRPIRRIKPLVIGTKSSFFVACHGLGFGLKAVCSAPRLHCYCSLYCSDQPQYATIADKTLVNSKRIQTAFGRKMRFCSLYLQSNASPQSLIPSGTSASQNLPASFPWLRLCKQDNKVPPRFELGSLDSESRVLTITPWNHRIVATACEAGRSQIVKRDCTCFWTQCASWHFLTLITASNAQFSLPISRTGYSHKSLTLNVDNCFLQSLTLLTQV